MHHEYQKTTITLKNDP